MAPKSEAALVSPKFFSQTKMIKSYNSQYASLKVLG